jgi:hypothetical protein
LYGEKEWLIFPPDSFVGDVYEKLVMVSSTQVMDAVNSMDVSRTIYRCRQKAGEVIWIPDGWWHATYSHTETGCVGGQRHKNRLPEDYWEYNHQLWPDSGIFVNGLARQLGNASLFEAAVKMEPYNFHFMVECLAFLKDQGKYAKVVKIGKKYRSHMEKMWRNGSLGRAEFAAILADMAGFLYQCVEHALKADEKNEILLMTKTTNLYVDEALSLDPECPLAVAIRKRIDKQSEVGVKQMEQNKTLVQEMMKLKGAEL